MFVAFGDWVAITVAFFTILTPRLRVSAVEYLSMELTDLQAKHESTRDKVAQLGRFL